MTEETQAAPADLDEQIKQELAKESAPLETEKPEAEPEPQAKAEGEPEAGSEYVETENEKVQARINKKHFEMMEAKREADALRAKVEELTQSQAVQPVTQPQSESEPTLDQFKEEDFDYDDTKRLAAYTNALTNHRIEKTLAEREGKLAEQQQNHEAQQRQAQLTDKFLSEAADYSAKNPAYLEDIANLPVLSQDKLDLLRANGGPKMVHYLSKNPEAATQFAQGDFGSAAVQLGALQAQIGTNTKPIETSNAPNPVETVSGSPGAITKDIGEMSMEEIMSL